MKKSSFQMIGKPQVTNIRFCINKEYLFSGEIPVEINSHIHISKNSDEQKREAIVTLSIEIFTEEDDSNIPFKLVMENQGCFVWDEELSKDSVQLETMLKQNAPAVLYSYLRPIISLITIEANMPPLVLPLMNFVE
ncbi:MAG: hypothetical protein GX211_11605 [Clostridiaceae bacterium]|nr:hypothetical protein [Clostridiaceae bacterium]